MVGADLGVDAALEGHQELHSHCLQEKVEVYLTLVASSCSITDYLILDMFEISLIRNELKAICFVIISLKFCVFTMKRISHIYMEPTKP